MAFPLHGQPPRGTHQKAARLARLAHAGFPVPDGWVLEYHEWPLADPQIRRRLEDLVARGPVIVRMVLPDEDTAGASAAGLGVSVANCTDITAIRHALQELAEHGRDPWLKRYRQLHQASEDAPPQAIVQQQIPRRWLLVIALFAPDSAYIEVHSRRGDVLATGASPDYAGPLEQWPFPEPRRRLQRLCTRLLEVEQSEHGLDVEVVIDPDDTTFVVQLRPIVAELDPGWPAFLEEVRASDVQHELRGLLVLDIEHNPAPLSPAHTWLMQQLARQRPSAGEPTVLAGWLYVRTLPRDLSEAPDSVDARPLTACEALHRLHTQILPGARTQFEQLQSELRPGDPQTLISGFERAFELFLHMIDTYVGVLIPARKRAWAHTGHHVTVDLGAPFSLRGRSGYLDVLPTVWDIASPSLADSVDIRPAPADATPLRLPRDEPACATLLGEWDDHLFALGLAPLRHVYLQAAEALGLDGEQIFFLRGDELLEALAGHQQIAPERLRQRARAQQRMAELRPPLRIYDGHPLPPSPGEHLRGIPVGESFQGTIRPYRDLQQLVDAPPTDPDAIVVLPALTAQAAVALQQLGVRAVCCEHGGVMSHAALMARELSLSALIGCRNCMLIPAGTKARVDTRTARLVVLDEV